MTFPEIIAQYLGEIDPILSEQGMPLRYRALHAAMMGVEDLVIDVQGGTKENPIGQAWFDALHFEVLRWYHERYAEAMDANRDGTGRGVVSLGGVLLTLTFPLTVVRPGSAAGTNRLHFPEVLRDDENAVTFLDARVGLHTFSDAEQTQLRADIAMVVGHTRRLNRGLRFADVSARTHKLVDRVMWTLCQAAESLGAGSADRLALAIWELNLIAELTLKVFLAQNDVEIPKTHAVRTLHKKAVAAGMTPFPDDALVRFPSERNAIRYRYGEKAPPATAVCLVLYDATLMLAVHVAAQCRHGIWVAPDGWIEVRTIGSLARGA